MPYGSIDLPAHDSKRTVGSKCHVWQSKLRQSRKNRSTSDFCSLDVMFFVLSIDCNVSVEPFFVWLPFCSDVAWPFAVGAPAADDVDVDVDDVVGSVFFVALPMFGE